MSPHGLLPSSISVPLCINMHTYILTHKQWTDKKRDIYVVHAHTQWAQKDIFTWSAHSGQTKRHLHSVHKVDRQKERDIYMVGAHKANRQKRLSDW